MRTIEDIRARVLTQWNSNWPDWLGNEGSWPKAFGLDPPTEREAQKSWHHFSQWVVMWNQFPPQAGVRISFATRAWPTLGAQEVPDRIEFESPRALSSFLGREIVYRFERAEERFQSLSDFWPDLAKPLRSLAATIGDMDQQDNYCLKSAVNWLSAHPDTGLYVRQLPIIDVDSKWIEKHSGILAKLLGARLGRTGTLHEVAGLAVDPPRRRIRILDPKIRSMVGGLSDLNLRIDELASLQLPFRLALVVENLQTALACEELPGTVVLMGGGYSVTELSRIPWLDSIPLLYWGDLDTNGFAILHALRRHHSHTNSVLMDEDTLQANRDLWGQEDKPVPATTQLDALTPAEQQVRERLQSGLYGKSGPAVRLEQERLPWQSSWDAVKQKVELLVGT